MKKIALYILCAFGAVVFTACAHGQPPADATVYEFRQSGTSGLAWTNPQTPAMPDSVLTINAAGAPVFEPKSNYTGFPITGHAASITEPSSGRMRIDAEQLWIRSPAPIAFMMPDGPYAQRIEIADGINASEAVTMRQLDDKVDRANFYPGQYLSSFANPYIDATGAVRLDFLGGNALTASPSVNTSGSAARTACPLLSPPAPEATTSSSAAAHCPAAAPCRCPGLVIITGRNTWAPSMSAACLRIWALY
jgi:hypothetical protein